MSKYIKAFFAGCAFLALATASTAQKQPGEAKGFLIPKDGSILRTEQTLFVYSVPSRMSILIRIDGKPVQPEDVSVPGNDWDLHHVKIRLDEGRHEIRLLDASDESEIDKISATYIPPYSLKIASSPGDKKYSFHSKDLESNCIECHSLPEVFETVPSQPLAPAGKVCGACHPGVESQPKLHGPTAVYACFMCHEAEYAPSRFALKTSQPAACGACHENFLSQLLASKEYVHGPVAGGNCLICHNPHGGETGFFLREPSPQLCLRCHSDTLALPINKTLHGKVECTACHNPHGGRTQILAEEEGNDFCGRCHADVAELDSGHPLAKHPIKAAVDPSNSSREFGCVSCHQAHSKDDISTKNIKKNESESKLFCRKCHY